MLDIAVGAGALEVVKYLLEFHTAKPSRETLKMAISAGHLELIRLILARLPELVRRDDLMKVACDFHREEVLTWLWRDATTFEGELFVAYALQGHYGDALVSVLREGYRPWWGASRALAAAWRAAKLEFGPAPNGFSVDGGWWVDASGAGRPFKIDPVRGWVGYEDTPTPTPSWVVPPGAVEVTLPLEANGWREIEPYAFATYAALERVTVGPRLSEISCYAFLNCQSLREVELPAGLRYIGRFSFAGSGVRRMVVPDSVTVVEEGAFASCAALIELVLPAGLTTIERWTCQECVSLSEVRIPSGVTAILEGAFVWCVGLMTLTIPVQTMAYGAFWGCSALRRVILVGDVPPPGLQPLSWLHERDIPPDATFENGALAGQTFGRFAIVAPRVDA
jgi:hypothetical protein